MNAEGSTIRPRDRATRATRIRGPIVDSVESASAAALTEHLYAQVLAGRRDILQALLHDDFVLAGTRERIDRDGWVDLMVDGTTWDSIDVRHVGSDGGLEDAMVVTSLVDYAGERDGEPLRGTWNVIDIWQRRGIDWTLLSRTTFPSRH